MPLFVINLKAYAEGTGKNAERFAKSAEKIGMKNLIVAAQPCDLFRLSKFKISLFSQYVDPVEYGAKTGHLPPKLAKECGAKGTLLNHSENRIPMEDIEKCISLCKEAGLKTIVCVENVEEAKKVDRMKPNYIAIEPKDLIGSGIPVSKAEPELVIKAVNAVKTPVLCGAGINSRDDFLASEKLGTKGVLVASAMVKAKNQEKALRELVGK